MSLALKKHKNPKCASAPPYSCSIHTKNTFWLQHELPIKENLSQANVRQLYFLTAIFLIVRYHAIFLKLFQEYFIFHAMLTSRQLQFKDKHTGRTISYASQKIVNISLAFGQKAKKKKKGKLTAISRKQQPILISPVLTRGTRRECSCSKETLQLGKIKHRT